MNLLSMTFQINANQLLRKGAFTPSLSGFRTTLGKAFLLNQTVGFSGNCGRPLLWNESWMILGWTAWKQCLWGWYRWWDSTPPTKRAKKININKSFIHSFKVQNEAPTSAATLMKTSQIYTVKRAWYGHVHSDVWRRRSSFLFVGAVTLELFLSHELRAVGKDDDKQNNRLHRMFSSNTSLVLWFYLHSPAKPQGSPNIGRSRSTCHNLPPPAHTAIQYKCSVTYHSCSYTPDFGRFTNGLCCVMAIAVAESNPWHGTLNPTKKCV